MADPLFVRISYEWGNPYREPPEGQPRVLRETFYPYATFPHHAPPEIMEVWKPGSGYRVTYTFINEPPKQQSQAALATTRQKRLRRRMEKKYPLLAEQFITEETAKNPDYYNGITRADLQEAHDRVIDGERARIEEIRRNLAGP